MNADLTDGDNKVTHEEQIREMRREVGRTLRTKVKGNRPKKYQKRTQASEPIRPDVMYQYTLIPITLGFSKSFLSDAICSGLETAKIGGKAYIKGQWLIDFIESHAERGCITGDCSS